MPTNALHTAFKDASLEEQQLALIASSPELLREEDDSWEGWLPLHNAARWCASGAATSAALAAYPDAAKTASRGGYEALHLAAMGGAVAAVKALIAVYPEGALKKDGNGRTPLDEGREGSSSQHGEIVELLLALPGVREADEAEAAMKEQRARELMRPDDAPALDVEMEAETEAEADVDMAEADADADGLGLVAAGRAIASRMLRAASNALWRSTPEGDVRRAEVGAFFSERAKYIPLRLQMRERKLLRLVEAVLHVSHYTDRVDDNKLAKSVAKRTQMKLRELHAVMSGMLLACDYEAGQYAMKEGSYEDFAEFFAELFEVTRRYKIMNPEKLRDNYGKLMHLLMDANSPAMQEELDFSVVRPIKTVYSHLEEKGVLGLLADERMAVATQVVAPEPGKSRGDIRREIKEKEAAIEYLARRYHTRELPAEDLKQCLYSIGDNNAYLLQARDPCDRMIAYLREYFPADGEPSAHTSLAISGGEGGARLSHSHQRQRAFVLQSLTLWREIANDMFRLWYLAEDDMLRPGNEYEQRDTGQGVHRVQVAPRTSRAMHQLLHSAQQGFAAEGGWVGSTLIHLGDSNVPNALMFIDKYSQVEHILNPIIKTLAALPKLHEDQHLGTWIDATYGGVRRLTSLILQDFFRYAFDGSGADNFFDAGSCIDGRLTSAWNWCSQLSEKPFFVVFKLAGFGTFDGAFQD